MDNAASTRGRDVLDGLGGAAIMLGALVTPFLRSERSRWGVSAEDAARTHPGDDLVPRPLWGWTHGVELPAERADVWPWLAQVGATRGGFYSYAWLENLAGCKLQNASEPHVEWELHPGDDLVLHPRTPPLTVARVRRGEHFVAFAPADEAARREGRAWITASWLFILERLGPRRTRAISRYRVACSDDAATRLSFGPTLLEPIAFAMDRRMLLGLRARVMHSAARFA